GPPGARAYEHAHGHAHGHGRRWNVSSSRQNRQGRPQVVWDERHVNEVVPVDARHRHDELSQIIDEANYRYYVLDSPTLSDADYDQLMRELGRLEEQY